MLEYSVALSNGARGNFIKTDRFKTTLISYNFYLPLCREKVADFSLLPFVLTTCGKEYPDFSKLNFKLNKLYSASLCASTEKVGDYQLLKMSISVLDDKYALDGELLVTKATELLNSLIFEPRLDDKNAFFASDVEREKRKAIEHIRGELADKRTYAKKRLVEEMYKDDVYGIPQCGTEEQVAAITPTGLYSAWKELISRGYLVVDVISSTLPLGIFDDIKNTLSEIDRSSAVNIEKSIPTKPIYAANRVTDKMDVSQGKLVMGFSMDSVSDDRESASLNVMCSIFGGGTYSRLFTNVREKMGLCYYCIASAYKQKGLLVVESGVEAANSKKAELEIIRQLDIVKNGQFTDFEFDSAKISLINMLKSYGDNQEAIDAWYTIKSAGNQPVSPEEFAELVSFVSRDDVINSAKNVKLHTVYNLLPKGDE